MAHETALSKLHDENVIDWRSPVPLGFHLIPLTVSVHNKWNETVGVCNLKTQWALRGDLFWPALDYDPEELHFPTTGKGKFRLLFANGVGHLCPVEHM